MLPNKCEYFIKISLFNLLSESVYGTQLHHIHAVKSTINSRLGHSDFGSRGQMFLVSFLTISKTTSYLKISFIIENIMHVQLIHPINPFAAKVCR